MIITTPMCMYRAKNGVGLIVTGGIAPNRQGKLSPFAAKLSNPLEVSSTSMMIVKKKGVRISSRYCALLCQMRVHRDVTSAVHEHDGKIAMQILHAGRYAYHPWLVAPSAIKVSQAYICHGPFISTMSY